MAKKAVRVSEKEITFEDGYVTRTPFNIGLGAVSNMVEEHGNIVKQVALPQDPDKLHVVLLLNVLADTQRLYEFSIQQPSRCVVDICQGCLRLVQCSLANVSLQPIVVAAPIFRIDQNPEAILKGQVCHRRIF